MNIEPRITFAAFVLAFTLFATPASALMHGAYADTASAAEPPSPPLVIAQRGCTSLSQAVEQVRRRGDVERVVSAETQVRGGREVHVIKVLTRDGRVTTHRIPGCPVN